MHITIDGQPTAFTPLRDFRAAHNLPTAFGVALFEPKDYAGLGHIDGAGAALNSLREALLNALPARITPAALLALTADLTERFRVELTRINPEVGLREAEIEFAVAGFGDVCNAYAYALLRDRAAHFQTVYRDWLGDSVRVFSTVYAYEHAGERWQVRVAAHAYGRFGLLIETPRGSHAVYDPALACPAKGFMAALLSEVCAGLAQAVGQGG
jgi:hypothetical protein